MKHIGLSAQNVSPTGALTDVELERWYEIHIELGKPEGHIISSNYPVHCTCPTCKEYEIRIKMIGVAT